MREFYRNGLSNNTRERTAFVAGGVIGVATLVIAFGTGAIWHAIPNPIPPMSPFPLP